MGFHKLHDLLSIEELIEFVTVVNRNLSAQAPDLYRAVLEHGLGYRYPIWVMWRPIIRFHVPYDRAFQRRELLEEFRSKRSEGRLTTIRPHRDDWFTEPSTCINIWISLGTVVPGNGLSIFPDDYANALSYEPSRGVTRSQAVTRPTNVSMNEGDALFFHASHLHASEINYSDLTRTVLSLRLATEEPRSTTRMPWRYRRVYPRWPATFKLLNAPKKIALQLEKVLPRLPFLDASSSPCQLGPRPDEVAAVSPSEYRRHHRHRVSVDDLTIGRPLAVSDRHFIVKLDRDGEQIWRLERRCPHEGADLALGYTEGRHIRCPWHNLRRVRSASHGIPTETTIGVGRKRQPGA